MPRRAPSLTVASWNVNSLATRLPLVVRYLETYRPDVVCVQETRVRASFDFEPIEALGYEVRTAGSGGYAGMATLSRLPIGETVAGIDAFVEAKAPGRRLLCRIGDLWIDSVYVPTRMAIGKSGFLDALARDRRARFSGDDRLVLAGDFNICFDARDYASPSMITDPDLHPRRPEDRALRRAVRGLRDCFREREAAGGQFTWFPMTSWSLRRNYGMRLDYVFASPSLADRVVEAVHDRDTRSWPRPSDHLPVRVRFDLAAKK